MRRLAASANCSSIQRYRPRPIWPWSRSGSVESTATTVAAVLREHRVAVAEQLLEVDVADVARVVVPGDDDERLALDPVEVALRLDVLVLEPEGRQVAGADDDVRIQVVDLADRPLHQEGTKYWPPQWRSERCAIWTWSSPARHAHRECR